MKDLKMANKVIRKVKSFDVSISFCKLEEPLQFVVFCDASHANLPNGGSQGGQVVFMKDAKGFVSPVSWTSKKVRRVCRSTLAAETMSMLDAMDTTIWLQHIVEELTGRRLKNTIIKTDNDSLQKAAYSTTAVEEKRLRVDIAAIRDEVRDRVIAVEWIEKEYQLADVLTKQGAGSEKLLGVLKSSVL